MKMRIPLSDVYLTPDASRLAHEALDAQIVSGTGPMIGTFERNLAVEVERGYACAVTNGTVALELALLALGIGPGDEVIVPALTFAAPAAAVCAVGAIPVFADVHPDHWTIDPEEVVRWRTPKTKAIIAVDVMGHPCDWNALYNAAEGIPIIEDAAEAHGAMYIPTMKWVGSFGILSTFSFHANKTIPIGEGGAVLTDSPHYDRVLHLIANHGMTRERAYWHEVVGHNYRMTNVTAAIGTGQVLNWGRLVKDRQAIARKYDQAFDHTFYEDDLKRRPVANWAMESVWLYTMTSPNRDAYLRALWANSIDARAIWPAIPTVPAYQKYSRGSGVYPVAQRISQEAFWLPTYINLRDDAIYEIAEVMFHVQIAA